MFWGGTCGAAAKSKVKSLQGKDIKGQHVLPYKEKDLDQDID
jgi:hypothetical protein